MINIIGVLYAMHWDDYWKDMYHARVFYSFVQAQHAKRYKKLLNTVQLKNPDFLEIGAGSGMLCTLMLDEYGGTATILDNSKEAYDLFKQVNNDDRISYVVEDVFKADISKK